MKMEAGITTAVAGTVDRALLTDVQQVQGGDLLLVISPTYGQGGRAAASAE